MNATSHTHKQAGIALIMSLIFLVLLTLLVVSAMKGSVLQERMAGNTRDRMLAFQAAEAALRTGDGSLGNAGLPSGSGIYYAINSSPAAAYTTSTQWITYPWSSSAAMLPAGSIGGVTAQPQYVIERLTTSSPNGGSVQHSISFKPSNGAGYYRITSRGVGATVDSVVILQEFYARN